MKNVISRSLFAVVVILAGAIGQALAFDNSSVSGTFNCTGTSWVNSQQVASGTVTLVSDGNGRWTSGSSIYQLDVPGTQGSCNYTLRDGKYRVGSDGNGMSFTEWQLAAANSSPACRTNTYSSAAISASSSGMTFSESRENGSIQGSGQCTLQAQ